MKILEKVRSVCPNIAYKILQMNNNAIKLDGVFADVYWELAKEGQMLLSIREAYNIYYHLSSVTKLGGAVAELGVYKGGGAKLICNFKSELPLHLFDTFNGMPDVNSGVDKHNKGDFSDVTLQKVESYLERFSNVCFHKGFFPETTQNIADNTEYCFVHLDADIYESTISGLSYFYPRIKKGGVIMAHDYNSISCPGVKKAFDEFFVGKHEDVTPLWDSQCMVRKQS